MSTQTAIRPLDEFHARQNALVARTGRTVTFHIRDTIEIYLEGMENLYAAEQALIEHRKSILAAQSLDKLDAGPGLGD